MLLNAKQHLTLAHYVSANRNAQRDAGRTLSNPEWQAKRQMSFLGLAKMTAKRSAVAKMSPGKPSPMPTQNVNLKQPGGITSPIGFGHGMLQAQAQMPTALHQPGRGMPHMPKIGM